MRTSHCCSRLPTARESSPASDIGLLDFLASYSLRAMPILGWSWACPICSRFNTLETRFGLAFHARPWMLAGLAFSIEDTTAELLNLDLLTYAGDREMISGLESNPRYRFQQGNISDPILVERLLTEFKPDAAMSQKVRAGQMFNVGGSSEENNLEVVDTLCRRLDDLLPESPHRPHVNLKTFIADVPGHNRRYAIVASKIHDENGGQPQ